MKPIKKVNGIWVPLHHTRSFAHYEQRANDLNPVLKMIEDQEVVVQAGGHLGSWPIHLAKHFERVFTFEPDETNFECLRRNVEQYSHVTAEYGALCDATGFQALYETPKSDGHFLLDQAGTTPTFTVDSLGLDRLDFLCLDVEGWEYPALEGAIETIHKFKPVILLEHKESSVVKGRGESLDQIKELLEGYEVLFRTGKYDIVLGPKT